MRSGGGEQGIGPSGEREQARARLALLPGRVGDLSVTDYSRLKDVVREKNIIVGVLAVPAASAQRAADDLVDAGVKIIFNYSEALIDAPHDVTVHTFNPAVDLLHALYFHLT